MERNLAGTFKALADSNEGTRRSYFINNIPKLTLADIIPLVYFGDSVSITEIGSEPYSENDLVIREDVEHFINRMKYGPKNDWYERRVIGIRADDEDVIYITVEDHVRGKYENE